MRAKLLAPDLTWTGEELAAGVRVAVDDDGRIAAVAPASDLPGEPDLDLTGCALLPGFVSAHSHAFQRGLRGRGERFPEGGGSFWTWREAMYGLVETLDEETFSALCRQAFAEMRRAGVTTVGEFHYLRHRDPEALDHRFDELVLAAAGEAGIRIALIAVYYKTGAVGRPLAGAQRRFASVSVDTYLTQLDRLAARLTLPTQTLAASVHSLRAAGLDDLAAVYDAARRRGLRFHIHVEEQRREIEEALTVYGKRPMTLLLEALGTATDVTAVHCTHTLREDMERFLTAGGTVCLCPLTEANLGDGISRAVGERPDAASFCLGTDSNARLSMLEEMRWMEYAQRLATESRGVVRDAQGRVARQLLQSATATGAAALGVDAGRLEPGFWADFTAIDLRAPSLAGWEPETLLESIVFGAGDEVIAGTAVGGEWSLASSLLSRAGAAGWAGRGGPGR